MSTFYDENGNEKETMQSEETENLRKRKRKKAKLRKIKRKVKKLKNSVFGDLELLSKQDRRKMKKYKNQKKTLKKQLNVIERQLSDHEKRLSGVEDGISRITPVVERIQGYQKQEILQKITASNDIREVAKLLENAQGGVFNVKSL